MAQAAPSAIRMSPTLKTFARGHEDGIAKASPRNHRRAFATYAEFAKTSPGGDTPAVARAPRVAGITPVFAAIATRFRNAPTAISQNPAIERLRTRNATASA